MKISTYLFLFLAVFTNNHSHGCSPQLSDGEYLSKDLLKYLKEFKNRKKDPPNGLLGFTVKKEGNETYLTFLWNMHEGDIQRLISSDCSLNRVDGANDDFYNIQLISRDKIQLFKNSKLLNKFSKVQSIENEINRWTIEGAYLNQSGESYLFNRNGIALIKDQKLKYRINLDRIEFDVDIIVLDDGSSSKIMSVNWANKQVTLKEFDNELLAPNKFQILTPKLAKANFK